MKSILLSIRPEWVEKILNGEKTIEVRKLFPKKYVGWVYIYCTKGERHWQKVDGIGKFITYGRKTKEKDYDSPHTLNGKVVARFWCDNVEEIFPKNIESFTKDSCLTVKQIEDYLWKNIYIGYAIHISKLEIFNRPKYLTEYYKSYIETEKGIYYQVLIKAPQNYCYIEGEE